MGCRCHEGDGFENADFGVGASRGRPGPAAPDPRPDPAGPEEFPRMKVYRCFDPRTFTFQCVRIR